MRKLTLLLGSLGGALAGYVFSNKKLRQEPMNAKDAQTAAKVLGKHLSSDGQTVAKEARQFAEAHQWDKKVAEGKKYVQQQYKTASKEVQKMVKKGKKEAEAMVKNAKKKVMGRGKKA